MSGTVKAAVEEAKNILEHQVNGKVVTQKDLIALVLFIIAINKLALIFQELFLN